jgi:hypothetical protein
MSQVISPPSIYFNGINFNSEFYAQDTAGGLTTSQANALYLRKTITDTATALETFNSGVATASVSSTSSSTNMTVGSNLAPTQTLTLGSTGTITVNNGTLQSQSLAPVAPASNLIIGANSTAGINIGNAGVSTTNLYGTVQAGTIDAFTTTGTLNLGQNLVGGTLNIATGSNNDVNVGTGNRTIAVVHNYSDGNNAVAGSNVHLNNGTSNLSNTNIHNGASSAGIVNIGNGVSSTTAVSIATRGSTSTNAVRIGNVSNTTYLDSDIITLGALGLTGSGAISLANGTNVAGAQVSIGSTSLTAVNIKGGQTNIETTTLNLNTNGTGNTLIGTSGGSNSITFNRPLTVGYTPPANLLASLVYIGGIWSATSVFVYTIGTTTAAYAPLNNLPNGRYLFQVYVFMPPTAPTQINVLLCDSTSAISNAQVSGLSVIYGGNESYTTTATATNISVNPFFQHDVASPKNNVAMACASGATLSGSSVFTLKAIRIG